MRLLKLKVEIFQQIINPIVIWKQKLIASISLKLKRKPRRTHAAVSAPESGFSWSRLPNTAAPLLMTQCGASRAGQRCGRRVGVHTGEHPVRVGFPVRTLTSRRRVWKSWNWASARTQTKRSRGVKGSSTSVNAFNNNRADGSSLTWGGQRRSRRRRRFKCYEGRCPTPQQKYIIKTWISALVAAGSVKTKLLFMSPSP